MPQYGGKDGEWALWSVCAGPHCLLYEVPEGHTFSSLPHAARGGGSATWSIWIVVVKLRILNCFIPNLSDVA